MSDYTHTFADFDAFRDTHSFATIPITVPISDDGAAFGDAVARAVKRAIADAYFDAACAYIEPGDPGLRYEAR